MTTIFEDFEALIHTNGKWERLNTNNIIKQDIDLTPFVTETELNTILSSYVLTSRFNNLLNYYATKVWTQNQLADKADKTSITDLQTQINNLTDLRLQKLVVNSKDNLPTVGDDSTIYFVFTENNNEDEDNTYEEYAWLNDEERYELIGGGTTSVDYTQFITLTSLNDIARKSVNLSKFKTLCNNVIGSDMSEEDLACIRASDDYYWLLLEGIVEGLLTLESGVDLTDYYTKTEVNTLLNSKADTSTTYTKTQVDSLLNNKANTSDVYNQSEIDEMIGDINTYLGT